MSPPIDQSRRPRWPALSVSLGMHVLALLLLLWLARSHSSLGTVATPTVRSVGMAVAHRLPDHTRYVTEPQLDPADLTPPQATETQEQNSRPAAAPLSAAASPPIDLSRILAEMNGEAGLVAATGPAAGGVTAGALVQGRIRLADGRAPDQLGDSELLPGVTRSGRGAGRTTTEVFGVSGSGSTFVYVFDRSESMAAARSAPLRAAKTELIRSLETLTEKQQFQIIFYNDTPHVFGGEADRAGLVTGEPATIARARAYVQQTTAIGGTEHEAALRMALRMAPDVIFFLTDAVIQTMSEKQLDDITRRAENAGTTIHAIQFGTGPPPANTFLEQLVQKNGGGYRYVDVTSLK